MAVCRSRLTPARVRFIGRFKDIASLLRRSQVPLMMFSTARDAHSQLRVELGKLGGARP